MTHTKQSLARSFLGATLSVFGSSRGSDLHAVTHASPDVVAKCLECERDLGKSGVCAPCIDRRALDALVEVLRRHRSLQNTVGMVRAVVMRTGRDIRDESFDFSMRANALAADARHNLTVLVSVAGAAKDESLSANARRALNTLNGKASS